jgi:hypothetical protein
MLYMRIPRNKFWGWVIASMLLGLAVGLAIMLWRTASLSSQVAVLQNKVDAASVAASDTAAVQQQLAAAEASVTALTDQNSQLTSDLAAANKAPSKKTSTTSTTATGTISFIARTVSPSTVTTSGTMTLTVRIKGHATKVKMRVVARTSGVSFDQTYSLKKVLTQGNSERWQLKVSAPTKKGEYRYYATAYTATKSFVMPGVSAWLFTVK